MFIFFLLMKYFKYLVVDLFFFVLVKKYGYRIFIIVIRKNFYFYVGYIDLGLVNYDLLIQFEVYFFWVLLEYSYIDYIGYY